MAQQIIGVGTAPNDGQGNPIRTAFIKCNDNFSELYARAQVSPPPTLVGSIGDVAGWYAYDSSYFYYCFADYDGSSVIWAQVTQVGNVSLSSISSGTSNIQLTDVNGNGAVSIGGVSNVAVFTTTGQLVTGSISATGNITGNYVLGNGSLLSGLPETYSNANVAAYLLTNTGNIAAGNVTVTGNVTGGNLLSAGIISTSGNIASQGMISATGNIETAGYFVGTFVGNVTGNFVVPGANTQVIFNTNGNADAVGGFTFDTNGPNLLTVLGTISSQGNVVAGNITTSNVVTATGNVTGGNIRTAGQVTATGNVTGGNIIAIANVAGGNVTTAGLITATGNITGGNIRTAGAVTATGNVSGGNILVTDDVQAGGNVSATSHTGTTVSVSGNVTGGNLRTAGVITATGNITGNYFIGNGSQLSGIDTTQIQNGNSNVTIASAGSNVVVNVLGVSPVAIFANTGAYIQGLTSVTGNVIAGNISATAHTGTTVSVTGNATAGNILFNSGVISGSGNISGGNILFNAGVISGTGNIIGGNIRFNSGVVSGSGNITGGNLTVGTGTIVVGNIINGNGNGVGNIGNSSTYFNTVFAQATSAQYADLAENYAADAIYAPGTVVVFGGEAEITISKDAADERVAGVISTQPAHLMNAGQSGLPVALRGRVPVMVIGPVFKGDSLVTSSTSGHAQSVGRDRSYAQAVFAKAIETNTSPGEKIITAVIL
jgi:hypothetical protein